MAPSAQSDQEAGATQGLPGRLFDPKSSRYRDAVLYGQPGQWRVVAGDRGIPVFGTPEDVQLDAPVTGLPRKLWFGTGHLFECDDHLAFEHLAALVEARKVGRPKSLGIGPAKWVAIIVLAVVMPVAVWLGYPVAADGVAKALPSSIDRMIGESAVAELDGKLFKPSRLPVRDIQRIQTQFDEIVAVSDLGDQEVRLLFRRGAFKAIDVNALAFPDGTIILLDGLVTLSEHDDEIAAVLAHEIGHVKHRHSLRKIVRATGVTVLATMLLGDSSSLVEEIIAAGAGIAELTFSREFELESDREAGIIMRKLGRNPEALVDLLRRIVADCGEACEETGLLSTHPGLRDRLETVTRVE